MVIYHARYVKTLFIMVTSLSITLPLDTLQTQASYTRFTMFVSGTSGFGQTWILQYLSPTDKTRQQPQPMLHPHTRLPPPQTNSNAIISLPDTVCAINIFSG